MPSINVSKQTDSGRTIGVQVRLSTVIAVTVLVVIVTKKVLANKKKSASATAA